MTLAISVLDDEQVYFVSDTKLSYDQERNPVEGIERPNLGLKTFFLTTKLCVAFSGITSEAMQVVWLAHKLALQGVSAEIIAKYLANQSNLRESVDFLLADVSAQPTIYKISKDIFARGKKGIFWIGDADVANVVLKDVDNASGFEIASKFQSIIDENKFSSVGGIATCARGKKEGFKFVGQMRLVSPKYVPPQNEWYSIDWGSAATGGFGYTTLIPVEIGKNGWGVHFFQGNCGYFFKTDLVGENERLVWNNCRLEDAIEALNADSGYAVEHCGKLG